MDPWKIHYGSPDGPTSKQADLHINVPEGLVAGAPADLTALNPTREWRAKRSAFKSRATNSPFVDKTLVGRAALTIVDGDVVWTLEDTEEVHE